jgi:hypothetical protein
MMEHLKKLEEQFNELNSEYQKYLDNKVRRTKELLYFSSFIY